MNQSPDIAIICPSCQQQAAFYANGVNIHHTILRPDREGRAICGHCGYNTTNFTFTNKDYFYQIPVGDRLLYAGTKEHLLALRDYFRNYGKITEPTFDFPKSFYLNRMTIVKRIDEITGRY